MLPSSHRAIHVSLTQWIPCRNRGTQILKSPETLGQFLRKRRVQKRLKQYEAAKVLGISVVSLSKWERDLFIPKIEFMRKLAAYLGLGIQNIKKLYNRVAPQ
jgi:DNA-binding XRE family transcriptional regulator